MNKLKCPQTFNEKYSKIVKKMCKDLAGDSLKMMTWTYPNGWKFRLSISQINYNKFIKENNISSPIRGKGN